MMSPTALRKAAVLVASLDADSADRILDLLGPEQARLVRDAVVTLAEVDADEQRDVIDEFLGRQATAPAATGIELQGALVDFEARAETEPAALPTLGSATLGDTYQPASMAAPPSQGPAAAPFRFLDEAAARHVTPLMAGEHPQTIALVVSHMSPDRAAGVLLQLPAEVQAEVIARMVELDEAHPEIVREVEQGLESRLSARELRERRRQTGLTTVTRILEATDPRAAEHIVANLHHFDPALAEELVPPQCDFGDVVRLDDASLRQLLAAADLEVTALALAGASPELTRRALSVLPHRDARLLAIRLDDLGPLRLADLEAAQQELADLLLVLAAEGRVAAPLPRSLVA